MYAIYLRKSRADAEAEQHGHFETLTRHRKILTELAAKNRHPIGEIYQELVSGDTLSDRPQAMRLLQDVMARRWAGVYVMEVERLARGDTMDQGLVAHAFRMHNTRIFTPMKTYTPSDPIDETFFEFSLFMSRQEYKTINRRQQAGRHQSVAEGKYIGSRPAYGYRKVKLQGTRGYSLAIDEQEATIVRTIFDWYINGLDGEPAGITRIATRLTDLHIPPGQQAKGWSPCRIHRILTNPVYVGSIRWGHDKLVRTVTPSGIQKSRIIQSDDQCTIVDGIHPSIITQQEFDAAQLKLHTRTQHIPVRKGAKLANPLAGLIVCGECGHIMSHLPECGTTPAIIKCRTRGCPTVQNHRVPVEDTVLSVLRSWLKDAGSLSCPSEQESAKNNQLTDTLAAMQAEREKLLGQIDRLHDLVEQGVYSVEQYNERYIKLHTRMRTIEDDLAAENARIASQPEYLTPAELAPAITHLLQAYASSTVQQKNDMLKSCISKIVYRKTERGLTVRGHVYSPANGFTIDIYPKLR